MTPFIKTIRRQITCIFKDFACLLLSIVIRVQVCPFAFFFRQLLLDSPILHSALTFISSQYELLTNTISKVRFRIKEIKKLWGPVNRGTRMRDEKNPDNLGIEEIKLERLKVYGKIITLNIEKFVGYNNWRLPTLEEAKSLIEPKENSVVCILIHDLIRTNCGYGRLI
ncbi:MAG: hypothetical protein D8M57_04030 [Candidatus Scalindua sp. AMX11]|nr:MAG: hypothetical protein DWQ00_10665 [Candidatus Scalindua sp.]TDE66279.1 MAG: hypothetical protein D8M57_04030 [Candidatus Scalindua sp. AMX11]